MDKPEWLSSRQSIFGTFSSASSFASMTGAIFHIVILPVSSTEGQIDIHETAESQKDWIIGSTPERNYSYHR